MARPTKYATPICLALTILAAIGIIIGLAIKNPLPPIFTVMPAVGYEAYRTEGASTRWASWGLVVVFLALLIFTLFKIDIDLVSFFGESERSFEGYQVPLGDIKVAGATLMAVLALVLITRTRGIYTRWLAGIIIVSSMATVFLLAPEVFPDLLRRGLDEVQ